MALAQTASPSESGAESRRAPRTRTRIAVVVDLKGRTDNGTIRDLSTSGMCIDLEHTFFGFPGCMITIISKELGNLDAVVRWIGNRRIGVSFVSSSAAAAQVRAYHRFYHRKG
ncbi:PilZ domain-containing protein [Sinorhizobium meliloti]|nr:PilZ domain-containing protein [Sinorhizobium meliloti]